MSQNNQEARISIGNYIALIFAIIFFSGLLKGGNWYSVFDFTTLNGAFGVVVDNISTIDSTNTISEVTHSNFRGSGGSGARDGFVFALTLIPTVMFALGVINVLEHYGALKAARQLLSPLLKPLMGIPGSSGLSLIASLQSTDAGAAMTRQLKDTKLLTKRETDVFTMFQFTAGAAIVNFFSSGAVLFTLTDSNGNLVVPCSVGLAICVIFVFKFVAANLFRLYLNFTEDKKHSHESK